MAQHHSNGGAPQAPGNVPLGNSAAIPNVGQQADMHALYHQIERLSDQLAENRAETALLFESTAKLAELYAAKCRETSSERDDENDDDGIDDGIDGSSGGEATRAQLQVGLFRLEEQLVAKERELSQRGEEHRLDWALVHEYEKGVETMLQAVRPYAHNQAQYALSLHRHYNAIIQRERDENLAHRLEILRMQEHAARAGQLLRKAQRSGRDADLRWIARVQGLKTENRMWRRALGMEERDWDSGEDSDAEVAAAERGAASLPPPKEEGKDMS